MNRTVVLGVRHGQHPDVAVFAIEEAARQGVPLRLVHASNDLFVSRTLFDDVAHQRLAQSVDVERVVLTGNAADVLLAEARQASTLVLGADDPPWVAHALGNEIAGTVASRADAPVVVIPRTTVRERSTTEVVAAVDIDNDDLDGQLSYAFQTAVHRHDPLHILHVAGPMTRRTDRARRRLGLEQLLDGWYDRYPATPVRITVETGHAAHTCIIASTRASVLVLGQPSTEHGRCISPSVVSQVLRGASAPVAVVPAAHVRPMCAARGRR